MSSVLRMRGGGERTIIRQVARRAARVLVAVEPALLGQLLIEILEAAGEDEVIKGSAKAVSTAGAPFSVALVSEPPADRRIAEVVILLPAPGEACADVLTATGAERLEMTGPTAVLDLLDRFWPLRAPRSRTLAASFGTHGLRSVK